MIETTISHTHILIVIILIVITKLAGYTHLPSLRETPFGCSELPQPQTHLSDHHHHCHFLCLFLLRLPTRSRLRLHVCGAFLATHPHSRPDPASRAQRTTTACSQCDSLPRHAWQQKKRKCMSLKCFLHYNTFLKNWTKNKDRAGRSTHFIE